MNHTAPSTSREFKWKCLAGKERLPPYAASIGQIQIVVYGGSRGIEIVYNLENSAPGKELREGASFDRNGNIVSEWHASFDYGRTEHAMFIRQFLPDLIESLKRYAGNLEVRASLANVPDFAQSLDGLLKRFGGQ
ncbi:MAG: hypothetical protein AABX00_05375 [Nanoarchaeota archaeon]